jgi:hypothetical protein
MELAGEVRPARSEPFDACGKVIQAERKEIFRAGDRYSWIKKGPMVVY